MYWAEPAGSAGSKAAQYTAKAGRARAGGYRPSRFFAPWRETCRNSMRACHERPDWLSRRAPRERRPRRFRSLSRCPSKAPRQALSPVQGDDHDPATDHESRGRARLRRAAADRGSQGSAARPRAGTGEDRSLRRLPHRPARCRGRLAGEAAVAVHSRSRRRRLRRRGGQRSDPGEGRRPGRHPLAVHRLRLLRALPDRLGDPLREPAEHRLLGERRLCRIRIGRPELRRNSAEKRRIR